MNSRHGDCTAKCPLMIHLQYPFGAFSWPDTISLQTFLETSTLGFQILPPMRVGSWWRGHGPTRGKSWRGCPLEWISDMSNMLSPLMIGLLVFVLILTGTFVGRSVRRLLPRDDLTDETKSLVSVSMAVVSTISALVLGLLISNANSSFIALGGQVTSLSAQILRLGGAILQEAQVRIALVALAVTSIAIIVTASALNAIATSKSETEPRWNDLTHGSAAKFHYGIASCLYAERQQDISARATAGALIQNGPEMFSRPHSETKGSKRSREDSHGQKAKRQKAKRQKDNNQTQANEKQTQKAASI